MQHLRVLLKKTAVIYALLITSIAASFLFLALRNELNEPLYVLAKENSEIQSYLNLSEIYLIELESGAEQFGYSYSQPNIASEEQIDLSKFYANSMWLNLGIFSSLVLSLVLLILLLISYSNKFYKIIDRN